MKYLLSKIFDKVIFYESDCIGFGKKFDEEVLRIIEPLKESITDEELDDVKDMIYSASYSAEKYGFYLGIRVAVKILTEVVSSPDDIKQ